MTRVFTQSTYADYPTEANLESETVIGVVVGFALFRIRKHAIDP